MRHGVLATMTVLIFLLIICALCVKFIALHYQYLFAIAITKRVGAKDNAMDEPAYTSQERRQYINGLNIWITLMKWKQVLNTVWNWMLISFVWETWLEIFRRAIISYIDFSTIFVIKLPSSTAALLVVNNMKHGLRFGELEILEATSVDRTVNLFARMGYLKRENFQTLYFYAYVYGCFRVYIYIYIFI